MRVRKSARVLLINKNLEILLFKFCHTTDALAGQSYWATVGGGVKPMKLSNKRLVENY